MSDIGPRTDMIESGWVVAFDEDVGLGEIESDDGGRYAFHATAIADGKRAIAVGTEVHFVVVFAPRGRFEAAKVTPR